MNRPLSSQYPDKHTRILPWLHILGAALVVVLTAFLAAVHSPLGQEISAGESPGFDWIRANIIPCIGFALAYLILICWLQIKHLRQSPPAFRMLPLLICIEVAGIALVALLLYCQRTNFLPLVLTVLLVSLLLQVLNTLWRPDQFEDDRPSLVYQFLLPQGCHIKSNFAGGVRNPGIDDRTAFFVQARYALPFSPAGDHPGSCRDSWIYSVLYSRTISRS